MYYKLKFYIGAISLAGLLALSSAAQAEAFGNAGDVIRNSKLLFFGLGSGSPWTDIPENWPGPTCSGVDLAPSFSTPLANSYPLSNDPESPFLLTRRTFSEKKEWDRYEVEDGCVGGFGQRYLVRFSASAMNLGDTNLTIGNPFETIPDLPGGLCSNNHPYCGLYSFFEPHGNHLHADLYHYRLIDNSNDQVVLTKKIGIGTLDTSPLGQDSPPPNFQGFPTENGEGISSGWADDYPWFLPCQYVDVTDVPPGNYRLEILIDQGEIIAECDESNNVTSVNVEVLPKDTVNYVHDQGAATFKTFFQLFGLGIPRNN